MHREDNLHLDIVVTVHGAVKEIRLTRPAVGNAVRRQTFLELLRELAGDRLGTTRAIVLSAADGPFCGGIDLSDAEMFSDERELGARHQSLVDIQRETYRTLWRTSAPVICAVDGACVGAGISLVCHADLVIASRTATFLEPELKFGYAPQAALAFLIGIRRAKYMAWTGVPVPAEAACEWGLVSEVTRGPMSARERALAIAASIAELPQGDLERHKRLLNSHLDASGFTSASEWSWDQLTLSRLRENEGRRAFLARAQQGAARR